MGADNKFFERPNPAKLREKEENKKFKEKKK